MVNGLFKFSVFSAVFLNVKLNSAETESTINTIFNQDTATSKFDYSRSRLKTATKQSQAPVLTLIPFDLLHQADFFINCFSHT